MNSNNSKILSDPHALATPLMLIVVDEYGSEALDWETEVLWDQVEQDIKGTLPPANRDKLAAISIVLTTDRFHINQNSFNSVCLAIGGRDLPVNFKSFQVPTLEEVCWAVFESYLNNPLEEDEKAGERFEYEIRQFMKSLVKFYGFVDPPKPLQFLKLGELPDIGFEDRTMRDAIHSNQQFKKDTIDGYMLFRQISLVDQLRKLDLEHGDAERLIKMLDQK